LLCKITRPSAKLPAKESSPRAAGAEQPDTSPSIADVLLETRNPDVERDPGGCADRQNQHCGDREEQKIVLRQPVAAVSPHAPLGIHHSTVVSRRLSDVPSPLSSFLRGFRRRSPADNFAATVGHSCLVGALPPLQLVEYGPAGAPSLNFGAHWARLSTECCCNIAQPVGRIAPGRTAERAPTWLAGSDREGASSLNGYVTAGRAANRCVVALAAGDRKRHRHDSDKYQQLHRQHPRRGKYRGQFLMVGESPAKSPLTAEPANDASPAIEAGACIRRVGLLRACLQLGIPKSVVE
jgi:hypothetical protein